MKTECDYCDLRRDLEARNAANEADVRHAGFCRDLFEKRAEAAEARCAELEDFLKGGSFVEAATGQRWIAGDVHDGLKARAEAAEARNAELEKDRDEVDAHRNRLHAHVVQLGDRLEAAEARVKGLEDHLMVCLELPGKTVRMTWLRSWASQALSSAPPAGEDGREG